MLVSKDAPLMPLLAINIVITRKQAMVFDFTKDNLTNDDLVDDVLYSNLLYYSLLIIF